MIWRQIFLCFAGLCAGGITAAGVFALITIIGIIPRLAGKTKTGKHVHLYESAIIWGGIIGNLVNLFEINLPGGIFMLILFGLGSGCFVSCLIMALAETLDGFPIMFRRIRISRGISWIILGFALGKMAGAFWYFRYLQFP